MLGMVWSPVWVGSLEMFPVTNEFLDHPPAVKRRRSSIWRIALPSAARRSWSIWRLDGCAIMVVISPCVTGFLPAAI
jgi:hypothetical protein